MKETKKHILIRLNKNTDLIKKEERKNKEKVSPKVANQNLFIQITIRAIIQYRIPLCKKVLLVSLHRRHQNLFLLLGLLVVLLGESEVSQELRVHLRKQIRIVKIK